jgi:hypothetical protein
MKVVIDTSSLMALVRYYLPFDKNDSLKNFIKSKVESKEIILIDKVSMESKRNAQGFITKSLEFIEDKKNQTKTDSLLPKQSFLKDLENRFCYMSRKNTLNESEYENRKKEFLESADAKLILFCLSGINTEMLNFDSVVLVTEETRTDNDSKLFKKLPEICELLGIEHCNLPTLFEKYFGLKLSNYLK